MAHFVVRSQLLAIVTKHDSCLMSPFLTGQPCILAFSVRCMAVFCSGLFICSWAGQPIHAYGLARIGGVEVWWEVLTHPPSLLPSGFSAWCIMCWYGKFGCASTWCTLPIVVQVGNLVVGRVIDAKSCVRSLASNDGGFVAAQ